MRLSAKILALAAVLLPLACPDLGAQESFLRNLHGRDSTLVGDRLRYGAAIDGVEEGTSFALPRLQPESNDTVAVLSSWRLDTLRTRKARKGSPASMDLEISMDLSCFEEGSFELPPISMLRTLPSGRTDTLVFGSRSVDVHLMPVDTASYVPHDIRGQVRYPLTAGETLPYAAGVILLALAIAGICWLIRRRKAHGEGAGAVEAPHIAALRKLEAYRGSRLWVPEKQKQFYSGVTDVLREYIAARYGFGAQEMTTAEIFGQLSGTGLQKNLYDEMKLLFETSDFVKFAKMTVSDEENAKVLPQAIRFVTETYQEVLDKEAAQAAAGKKEG